MKPESIVEKIFLIFIAYLNGKFGIFKMHNAAFTYHFANGISLEVERSVWLSRISKITKDVHVSACSLFYNSLLFTF